MPRNSKDNSLKRYKTMVNICEKYTVYLSYPKARIVMKSDTKSRIKHALNYIRAFRYTLSNLDPKYIELIRNEFLSDNKTYWWRGKYSRATYYRKRNDAINTFLTEFPL